MNKSASLPAKSKPQWYAVYTYPQSERKVHDKAKQLGIEAFLPTQKVVRQWSDRKKTLEVPMFNNYVFVKTTHQHRFMLLSIRELVKFVCFDGQPVAIPDKQIQVIQQLVEGRIELEEEPYQYQIGQKVRVVRGHLNGAEGHLLRKNGKNRFVIQLDILQRAVSVELPASYLITNDSEDYYCLSEN